MVFTLIPDPYRLTGLSGSNSHLLAILRLTFVWCVVATCGNHLQAHEALTKEQIRKQLSITSSLGCTIQTAFPRASFDFRMHSPYQILLPIRAIRENPDLYLRVWTIPLKDAQGKAFDPPKAPHQMAHHYRMDNMAQLSKSFVRVDGSVTTGAGEYRHFLSIDDGKGAGCIREWKVNAKPPRSLAGALALQPGEVRDPRLVAFSRQNRVDKPSGGLRVAVMLNADNRSWRRVLADGDNMAALAATLRRIAEDDCVGEVALTVFTLEDQEVLYDQNFQAEVNFARLGMAFRRLKPGQIEVTKLSEGSEARFLADVLREREERFSGADLVVFVGARSPVTDKVPPIALESLLPLRGRSVSYLISNPFPRRQQRSISRDMVGHAVKAMGGTEKEIMFPGDLAKAVRQILADAQKAVDLRTAASQ